MAGYKLNGCDCSTALWRNRLKQLLFRMCRAWMLVSLLSQHPLLCLDWTSQQSYNWLEWNVSRNASMDNFASAEALLTNKKNTSTRHYHFIRLIFATCRAKDAFSFWKQSWLRQRLRKAWLSWQSPHPRADNVGRYYCRSQLLRLLCLASSLTFYSLQLTFINK